MAIGVQGSDRSYFSRLLTDLSKHGRITGEIALASGRRDLFDARSIEIPRDARVPLAALPVNPCRDNAPGPGVAAFFNLSAPVIELPAPVPVHMALQTVHLEDDGALHVTGKWGGAEVQVASHTLTVGNLKPHLDHIGEVLTKICSEASQQPIMKVDNLFALDRSHLQVTVEGGPGITFDAQERLPYTGLRATRTTVSLGRPTPDVSETSLDLSIMHECELLGGDNGAPRKIHIALTARMGALNEAGRCEVPHGSPALDDSDAESAPGDDDENTALAPYCAAIYRGMMQHLPVSGTLALIEQKWTALAELMPEAAQAFGDCRIYSDAENVVTFTQRGESLQAVPTRPISITVPAQHIPIRFGWLRRLLSYFLVLAVHEVSLGKRTAEGHFPARIKGSVGLRFGPWSIGGVPVSREMPVNLPDCTGLFEQIDKAAFKVAEEYTFSPLVNASHLVRVSQSNVDVKTERFESVTLEDHVLNARHTQMYLGRHPDGACMSILHNADLAGTAGSRSLAVGAEVTLQHWPEPAIPHGELEQNEEQEKQQEEAQSGSPHLDFDCTDDGLRFNLRLL